MLAFIGLKSVGGLLLSDGLTGYFESIFGGILIFFDTTIAEKLCALKILLSIIYDLIFTNFHNLTINYRLF